MMEIYIDATTKMSFKKQQSHPKMIFLVLSEFIVSCEYMCCESLKESFKKLMVLGVAN